MFGPEYHKIHTVFKRDDRGVILPGEFSREEFGYLADLDWRWTEKVDGTNIRLHWDTTVADVVSLGGRTDRAQIPVHIIDAVRPHLDVELWEKAFPDADGPVTVYGEGYGPKIQKGGGNYRDDVGLIVFDVRVGRWWLKPDDVDDVAAALGLTTVPDVADMSLRVMTDYVQHAATRGVGLQSAVAVSHGKMFNDAEGVVGTPRVGLLNRGGNRIVVKLKVKDFQDLERRGGTQ